MAVRARIWSVIASALCLLVLNAGSHAGALAAQPTTGTELFVRSQVLTIDSSRLFPETLLGQSILAAIDQERRDFAAENRVLAEELRVEELDLTDRRASLPREEFARLAEEFDLRVQAARTDRDTMQADIDARADAQERAFLREVRPILAQLMTEAGAAVLIEANTVFLRNDAVDITDIAIARINEATRAAPLEDQGSDPSLNGGSESGGALENAPNEARSDQDISEGLGPAPQESEELPAQAAPAEE